MRNLSSLSFLMALIVAVVVLQGCSVSKLVYGSGEQKWIPKNFNPEQTVLLVSTFDSKATISKYMTDNYPYRFEVATNSDTATKFSDRNLYRFMILPVGQIVGNQEVVGRSAGAVDFYFFDRLEGKKYPSTGKGSYKGMVTFKPLITTLVSQLKKR